MTLQSLAIYSKEQKLSVYLKKKKPNRELYYMLMEIKGKPISSVVVTEAAKNILF